MEQEPRPITRDDLHATYVERSIRELQRTVQEEEGVLSELRRAAGAVPVTSAAASLKIMKTAYDDAAGSDPFLPFPDSVLPALLAMRKTHHVLAESQTYLASQGPSSLDKARKHLTMEKARLDDQKSLQAALEARVTALRNGLETRSAMTAEQRWQEKLDALRMKKRDYDRDTSLLLKALRQFIQEHLGAMLAAEELGGPVVGGMVDAQTDDLAAGFSAQGKPRKPTQKADVPSSKNDNENRRQRRIDEIWGPQGGRQSREDDAESAGDSDGDDDDNRGANWDEATAAGAEMQDLTEQLLNALANAGGDSSSAYVTISRESAAARFLVRSKVAQFHPRDATRLRLIDFGRELDD